jgi:hypothetical protein
MNMFRQNSLLIHILELLILLEAVNGQGYVNECKKAHDNALDTIQFVGSPAFPRRTMKTSNCKFTVSVNYGVYIKLSADILEIPCIGANGIYIEEKGGRAGPFCAKKKMPNFISRDVFFDIHIIVETPLEPGWRVKIGYKSVKAQNGPKLPSARKNPPPIIMQSMDQKPKPSRPVRPMNPMNNPLGGPVGEQNQIFVDQELFPQSFDQNQPQNLNSSPGFGPSTSLKSAAKPKKKTWVSETWNGDRDTGDEPVFTSLGRPKLGITPPKDNGGGGIIMAVILLILLICVAIFLVHKRQQMILEEEKKQNRENCDSNPSKSDSNNLNPPNPPARNKKENKFLAIATKTLTKQKKEPTITEINDCIEHIPIVTTPATSAESMPAKTETVSKDSGLEESAAPQAPPRRTTSQDSAKSKQSQATTAPSISEYPKPPERKKRTGIRGQI